MTTASFLDGCHDCLERGHKSWESYFSKWDFLAKNEESITESGLIEELNEKLYDNEDQKKKAKMTKNTDTKKVNKMKKKAPIQRKAKNSKKIPSKSSSSKLLLQERMTRYRKVKTKARKMKKPKQEPHAVKISESLQDDSVNKQLELDLRTVFLNVLKGIQGSKTKWAIFGVLSQTMSKEEMAITTYRELGSSTKLANSDDIGRCLSFTNQDTLPVASSNDKLTIFQTGSLDVRLNSFTNHNRMLEVLNDNQILNNLRPRRDSGCLNSSSSSLNQLVPVDKFNETDYSCVSPHRPLDPFYLSPKVDFKMINTISKGIYSAKNLTHSYLNNSQNENEKRLKPLPLNLSGTSEGSESSKININKLSFLKARFSDVPEMNGRREKTLQNLCLHKRTTDVSLNIGNSNFVTPKRNPSERKCFSENILRGKKRGRSKLSFFDYVQDDDSDSDDPCENRPLVIRLEGKKPKIEEIRIDDSDSDDLESIFDRVRKP